MRSHVDCLKIYSDSEVIDIVRYRVRVEWKKERISIFFFFVVVVIDEHLLLKFNALFTHYTIARCPYQFHAPNTSKILWMYPHGSYTHTTQSQRKSITFLWYEVNDPCRWDEEAVIMRHFDRWSPCSRRGARGDAWVQKADQTCIDLIDDLFLVISSRLF